MKRVALTFDDGPGEWTPAVLDLLSRYEAKATFFLVGNQVAGHEALLERMLGDGHEIGNHTWSHQLLRSCDDERIRDELERTNERLLEVTGRRPTRFRGPQYDVDERVEQVAAAVGLIHTRGDIRPPDWLPAVSAPFIATLVLSQIDDGDVVGLHDNVPPHKVGTAATRRPTVEALAIVLRRFEERAIRSVTATELLGAAAQRPIVLRGATAGPIRPKAGNGHSVSSAA